MQQQHRRVRVWDPFVRVSHWSLLVASIVVWGSAEEQAWLHEQTGYFILALIGLRVLWGLIGSRHASKGLDAAAASGTAIAAPSPTHNTAARPRRTDGLFTSTPVGARSPRSGSYLSGWT